MSDNSVFITGAASGAFTDALSGLPPWATEDTASRIEGILRKTLNLQTKALTQLVKNATGSGGNSLNPKDANDELDKLVKNLAAENKQYPGRKKAWKDEEDREKKRSSWWAKTKTEWPRTIMAMGLLADIGTHVSKTLKENFDTYTMLNAAGVNLMQGMEGAADGFISLQQITALTNVRYTELAKAMEKYSTSVNSFGVGKFAKTIGAASTGLGKFGFSTKESADLLGTLLDTQRNFSDISNKTMAETTEKLTALGKNVFRLSLATGQSRAAIMNNMEAISKSTEANVLAGQIGDDAAEGMSTWLGSFKDQNLAKDMLALMAEPIKPLNDTFMNFTKVGLGGFAQSYTRFTEDLKGMPAEMKTAAFKSFVESNKPMIDAEIQRLSILRTSEAKASRDQLVRMRQQADAMTIVDEAEAKRQEATNTARTNMSKAWEATLSKLQQAFSPSIGMLETLTKSLTYLNKQLDSLIGLYGKLDQSTRDNIAIALSLAGVLAAVAGGAGILIKAFKLFGSLVSSIPGLGWLGGSEKGSGSRSGSRGSTNRGTRSGSGRKGSPDLLEKIGKGIGDIGKGLGTGIGGLLEGFLTGLAKGLTALGNTNVLKGVLALIGVGGALLLAGKGIKEFVDIDWETMAKAGVTLAALGAAGAVAGLASEAIIAGAVAFGLMGASLWVIGKGMQALGPGLEKFADGVQAFADINGANLIDVSKGVIALSGALAVFTGSSLLSGLGNLGNAVTGGLSKLFGDGTMLDQLKNFAQLGPGLQLSANAFGSLASNLSLISSALSSFSGIETLKAIVSTVNGLNVIKALAFGVIGGIGNTSISSNAATIPTTPRPSTLNSPSQVSTNPSAINAPAAQKPDSKSVAGGQEKTNSNGDLSAALDYQNSLLTQLLQSTNKLISVNQDILKYSRVRA